MSRGDTHEEPFHRSPFEGVHLRHKAPLCQQYYNKSMYIVWSMVPVGGRLMGANCESPKQPPLPPSPGVTVQWPAHMAAHTHTHTHSYACQCNLLHARESRTDGLRTLGQGEEAVYQCARGLCSAHMDIGLMVLQLGRKGGMLNLAV